MGKWLLGVFILLCIGAGGVWYVMRRPPPVLTDTQDITMDTLSLTSSAFAHNSPIPAKHTCDGEDISPPLSISGVPEGAESLVLIMDDPDAPGGTWDHWIVFNVRPTTDNIQQGDEPEGVGGKNSWGRTGYGGPCPPSGAHRYFFRIYALDAMLDLPEGTGKQEVERVMEGRVLDKTELVGLYARK